MPYHGAPPMRRCWVCAYTTDQRKKLFNPSVKEYVDHFICDPECEEVAVERYEHMEAELELAREIHVGGRQDA